MEKIEIREANGLDVNELEAHSRVQLLPDRIEMHRGHRHTRKAHPAHPPAEPQL